MVLLGLGRLLAGLLLSGDGLARALAGARIGVRPLSAHRKATAMPKALVAADLDLAADVGLDFATKVAFEFEVAFKVVAESDELIVGQVLDADVGIDVRRCKCFLRTRTANTVDVCEADFDALIARQVDAYETCHWAVLSFGKRLRSERWISSTRPGGFSASVPRVASIFFGKKVGTDPAFLSYSVVSCEVLVLTLTLLVSRVLTDHHDTTVATDDLALIADRLDARLDLHGFSFCGATRCYL